jgi:hypothetical protein
VLIAPGEGGSEPPLPFVEKKVKGSKSDTVTLFEECSLLVFDNEKKVPTPGRPKFIPPKSNEKSKSKPPSAFREIKDADLEDPAELHHQYKSPVKSSPSWNEKKKTSLSSNVKKFPPPPLNRRHTAEAAATATKKSKVNPPPPPPRKQSSSSSSASQGQPLKSALKGKNQRRMSGNKSEADLTTILQQLRQDDSNDTTGSYPRRTSVSLSGVRSDVDLSSFNSSDDQNFNRKSSFGQSMLSLHNDEEQLSLKEPAYHKSSSFGQSMLSLNDSQDLVLKEPQHSQSMMSFNHSADVGLDFSKSEPAGLDHAVEAPKQEKSHRKLSAFFSRRSTIGNSSPTNHPLPQMEIKVSPSSDQVTSSTPTRSRMLNNERPRNSHVVNMPYQDPTYGDSGLYTGEVDADKRPNGKGKMKYDNGIFYEGKWLNGMQDAKNCANRERMLSGFSSWKGQPKANGEKGCTVYGMEWIDLSGMSGKYTGTVDDDNLPHGKGIMKYDFGLIAEGEWIKGVLNGGSQNGQMAGGATVIPGGSIVQGAGGTVVGGGFPGGMSVVGGSGMSVVSGLGMMSISGGPQGAAMMPNPMMNQYGCMGGAMMQQMQPQMGMYGMGYAYDQMRRD